ncbi:MAG: hypothetical protein IKB13_03195 [Clostridia bacterium]|nr:hypothetical protein [Clostridia bacterium]
MQKKRFLLLLLPLVTLLLEILPYGAVCNFAVSPEETKRETFSYFSLTPYGYANFTPFITAVLTVVVFALLLIYCLTGKQKLKNVSFYILIAACILSFGQLLFGLSYFSVVGLLISLMLIAQLPMMKFLRTE